MAGRAGAPLPEGRLPTGPPPIAMGAGTDSPRHLTTHHVPSTDAPPFSSPHVRGNPRAGVQGVQPPGRGGLRYSFYRLFASGTCGFWKVEESSAGGPAAPRSPCRLRLEQGWTRHASTPINSFFIDRCSALSVPACPGQSCAGVWGVQPPENTQQNMVDSGRDE